MLQSSSHLPINNSRLVWDTGDFFSTTTKKTTAPHPPPPATYLTVKQKLKKKTKLLKKSHLAGSSGLWRHWHTRGAHVIKKVTCFSQFRIVKGEDWRPRASPPHPTPPLWQRLTVEPLLLWNSLCGLSWSQTDRDPLASTSCMLG